MHDVLNKHRTRTVDTYSHPSNHAGFIQNNIHIATFSSLPNVKPIDKDILTPAYGFGLYEKLSKLIFEDSLILKKNSLKELCKLYRVSHENIIQSLQANILESLFAQMDSTEDIVREFAFHALTLLCSIRYGRQCILQKKDYSDEFLKMCVDPNLRVRHRALSILVNLGSEREGCELLFKRQEEFINLFLEQTNEVDDINVKIGCLENLINLLKIPQVYEIVIEKDVFKILSKLLKESKSVKLQGVVCRYIGQLCYRKDGVKEAVRYEMIERIVDLLDLYRADEFREHASTALMFITLDITGKKQFLKTDYGVQLISGMVKNEKEPVMTKINGLKIVCNVSEEPKGYDVFGKLISNLEKQIKVLEDSSDPLLQQNLEKTLKRLKWKP